MTERRVLPEILDALPADDPKAVRSRRDLRWINAVMGNYRWIVRQITRESHSEIRWMELGAGDGGLARQIPEERRRTLSVTGIDFAPRPREWPSEWEWHQGDLFDCLPSLLETHEFDGLLVSLFLHHFDDSQLREIGRMVESFRVLVFVEPARHWLHHLQCYLARPLMNGVTHHDSHVSIDAGFRGDELALRLGLSKSDWRIETQRNWFGSYRFLASRKD